MAQNVNNGVERTLGKILATQERILSQLENYNNELREHIKEDKLIEKRIDKIENKFYYMYGFIAAIVGVFTITSDMLLAKLGLK